MTHFGTVITFLALSLPSSVSAGCPSGSFNQSNGNAPCTSCAAGQFQYLEGSTSCIPCKSGQYGATTGAKLCERCPPGKYGQEMMSTSSASCVNCAVGKISSAQGSTFCVSCASGDTTTSGEGKSSCDVFIKVATGTQVAYLVICVMILLACAGCSVCMTWANGSCKGCLLSCCGCVLCEKSCGKKSLSPKSSSGLPACLSGLRPLGSPGSEVFILQRQLFLLCWKRVIENTRNQMNLALFYAMPLMALGLFKFLYGTFTGYASWKSSGVIETFAAPLIFVAAVQTTTVSLVNEKSSRLREVIFFPFVCKIR